MPVPELEVSLVVGDHDRLEAKEGPNQFCVLERSQGQLLRGEWIGGEGG